MLNSSFGGSWIIFVLPAMLFAAYAQMKIANSFNKFSKVPNNTGYNGAEIARIILDRNGLDHVDIKQVPGKLTDHYDPRTETISLSNNVYGENSIASMSVAAHEVGHALQHAEGYYPLVIRNSLDPLVGFGSKFVWIFIALGFLLGPFFIELGITLFLAVVLFQVITLPVELNASRRALKQLENGISPYDNLKPAKEVLDAAALTYVAGSLVAVAELLRLLSLTNNRRRN